MEMDADMDYPAADFEIDTAHLTVSHKLTGTVFWFDSFPDSVKGNEVRVNMPGTVHEGELAGMCNAAGLHLKAQLVKTRS